MCPIAAYSWQNWKFLGFCSGRVRRVGLGLPRVGTRWYSFLVHYTDSILDSAWVHSPVRFPFPCVWLRAALRSRCKRYVSARPSEVGVVVVQPSSLHDVAVSLISFDVRSPTLTLLVPHFPSCLGLDSILIEVENLFGKHVRSMTPYLCPNPMILCRIANS